MPLALPSALPLLAMMVCKVARAASSCPRMTSQRGDSGKETRDASRKAPDQFKHGSAVQGCTVTVQDGC